MPRHEPRLARADAAIFRFEVRNQFLDESAAAGAVVGRVGEDVMTQPATRIEHDVNHLDAGDIGRVALRGGVSAEVRAAETGDFVNDRITPLRLGGKRTRQHDAGTQMRRATVEGRQQLAFDVHQLDAIRLRRTASLCRLDRSAIPPGRSPRRPVRGGGCGCGRCPRRC